MEHQKKITLITGNGVGLLTILFWAGVTDYHKLGALQQQKFILYSAGRQKSGSDVRRAMLLLQTLREIPSLPLLSSGGSRHPLACGCITLISASVFTQPSLCICVLSSSVFYKDICHWV